VRTCCKCGECKPLSSFPSAGVGKRKYKCKECERPNKNARMRSHHERHRDRLNSESADYRQSLDMKERAVRDTICTLHRKKRGGVLVDIDKQYLIDLWDNQGGLCALTGLPFRRTDTPGVVSPFSPSLDKIDHGAGYVRGNVRWLLFAVNSCRGVSTDELFLQICKAAVSRLA